MTKFEILARLDERRANFMAAQSPRDKSIQDAIQRTLIALDSPFSHYTVLSAEEREKVRLEWTNLAAHFDLKLPRRRAARIAPSLPPKVLAFFNDVNSIPYRPRASDNPERMGMQAMSWVRAQDQRLIELNPPTQIYWLTFDCDHCDYERWKAAGLLEPAFITVSRESGRHHVTYRLRAPVCRSERAYDRPRKYLDAISEGLRLALDGDAFYVGLLTKNPLHPAWLTIRPAEMPSYTLAQLAETVDLQRTGALVRTRNWTNPAINMAEVKVGGRNRALFDQVRFWARKNPNRLEDMLGFAESSNAQLEQPLSFNEVKSIVSSVERYMTNPRKNGGPTAHHAAFIKAQGERGKLGGRPKTTLDAQPWRAEGISRSTWYQRQADPLHFPKSGRGRPVTTKDSKPWLSEGISRATWYRQQKD